MADAETTSGNCSHGDLRLSSLSVDSFQLSGEGRLEVCVSDVWSTVCDTSFGAHDAKVACRQLGYDDESEYY